MPDGSSPQPDPARPPRRWRRRLLRVAAGLAVLPAIAVVVLWTWRAEVLNLVLSRMLNRWQITVESLHPLPGGGIEVRGITVRHPRAAEPVVQVARAVTSAPWMDLFNGHLHDLTLEEPVIRWSNDLVEKSSDTESKPRPFLSWNRIAIRSGRLVLRLLPEPAPPVFDSVLNWEGGGATIFSDGSLQTEPQNVSLTQPSASLPEAAGLPVAGEFGARGVSFTAQIQRETGLLTLTDVALDAPVVRLAAGPLQRPAGEPEPTGDPGPVRSAVIARARATDLDAVLQLSAGEGAPPIEAAAAGDLTVDSLQWSAGEAVTLEGGASIALRAGDGIRTGRIDGTVRVTGAGVQISSLSVSEAVWTDLPSALASLGVPAEITAGIPATSGTLSAQLADLSIDNRGVHSSSLQSITLTDFSLKVANAMVSAPSIRIEGVPDEVTASRRVRSIAIGRPDVKLTAAPAGEAAPATPQDDPDAAPPAWEGWTADALSITGGSFRAEVPDMGGSTLTASVDAVTAPDPSSGLPRYRLTLSSIALTHPEFPDAPPVSAGALEVEVDPATLWDRRELASVRLTGLRADIGEALMRLAGETGSGAQEDDSSDPPPAGTGPQEAAGASPPWKIASIVIDDTAIGMDSPGGGGRLRIPVKRLELRDIPLDAAALAALDDVYQVEIPAFTIYSPWVEGQKVLELDSNYIRFTPSGLMRKRLERVDIMLPSLYAGEPLFDYVEACRTRFAELTDTGRPALLASTGAAVAAAATSASVSGWHIPLYTGSGRVIVAPRGHPWPWIPVIPFRNARDRDGRPVPFLLEGSEIHGELAVDPGWYHFPDYKVSLRVSDRGRIVFNSPSRTTDNNLVEVFEGNTLIYRQVTIDNLWLAVTYDDSGIYARFGGETCGGDLTGGLNVYLDDLYTWDAWVSLTGADLQPLTEKLTPGYVRIDGRLDELTVKANGDAISLYQAFADLKMNDPGVLRIEAIDPLKEKMRELEPLARDLAEIGVEALRDFPYTSCTGTVRLFGQEGTMEFRLAGGSGSRNFRIRLHDYRGQVPRAYIPF